MLEKNGLVFIGIGFRDKATVAFSVLRHGSQRPKDSGLSPMIFPLHYSYLAGDIEA